MDLGIMIPVAIAVIFFATTVVLMLRQTRRKKPAWAYKTTKIIGLGTNAPPELKLTFNDRPVDEVYRTILILFNQGREAIRKDDVTEIITLEFRGAEILREPTIKATSKEAIRFVAKRGDKSSGSSIELGFQYLDHEDGAVVEVMHTKSQEITCSAQIIGAKRVANVGEFAESHRRFLIVRICVSALIAAVFIAYLVYAFLGYPGSGWKEYVEQHPLLYILFALFSGLTGYSLGILTNEVPQYLRSRRFPNWSKSISMPVEESQILAYCFKCRSKKGMMNPNFVTLKNGHLGVRGVCPDCGSKLFRIVG